MKIVVSIKIDKNEKEINGNCKVSINGKAIINNTSKRDLYGISGTNGALRKLTQKELQIVKAAIRAWVKIDEITREMEPKMPSIPSQVDTFIDQTNISK